MLVIEGTYENGQLQLDTPVAYALPVRVRVEFLDELSAAVHPPVISNPAERMRRLQASWAAAQQVTTAMQGTSLSGEVIQARNEEL